MKKILSLVLAFVLFMSSSALIADAYSVKTGGVPSASAEQTFKKASLSSPSVKLTIKNKQIIVKWSKSKKAGGYILYRMTVDSGKTKKLGTFDSETFKYVDKSVKNYVEYIYCVVAFRKEDGKTVKSASDYYVNGASTLDVKNIVRGAELKSKKSFKLYDVQNSKSKYMWTVELTGKDIKTLKKFAEKHFTSDMSALEKVRYTHKWIHKKVTYAYAGELWNKIDDKTFVDAVFNYKLGQCIHYNGALAAMMTYLGYDVKLLMGFRGTPDLSNIWQHFWTECKINGLTYVMETGNLKKNGPWYYFFTPYKYTSGYVKNKDYVSGL